MTCPTCLFGIRIRNNRYRCTHPATKEPTALVTPSIRGMAAIDRVKPFVFSTRQRWPFEVEPWAVTSCRGYYALEDALKARIMEVTS